MAGFLGAGAGALGSLPPEPPPEEPVPPEDDPPELDPLDLLAGLLEELLEELLALFAAGGEGSGVNGLRVAPWL